MHAWALQPFHAQNTHTQGHSPERSTENIAPQDPNLKPRTLKTKHKTPTQKTLRLEPLTGALRVLEKTLEGAVTGAPTVTRAATLLKPLTRELSTVEAKKLETQ